MNWFLFWLYLHIVAAIVAFGPIFVLAIVGVSAGKEPQHAGFALKLNERIERFLVVPFGLSMLISGAGLLLTADVNLTKTPFLGVAIILYLTAMGLALGVALPTNGRMLRIVEGATKDPEAAASLAQIPALVKRARAVGGVLQLLFVVIVTLMIVQPGGITTGPLFG